MTSKFLQTVITSERQHTEKKLFLSLNRFYKDSKKY